jgi:hypothetical protein
MYNEKYDENESKKDLYYENTMSKYQDEAFSKFGFRVLKHVHKFAVCVAMEYIQEEPEAVDIFDDLGLNELHACAILDDKQSFIETMQALDYNRYMSQYD